jgi:hypothetical protein
MDAFFDPLTKADLESLAAHTAPHCVSIHFPPHRASREVRQDAVRLRNLLDTAAERLMRLGLRRPQADELLAPGRALVDDARFWEHRALGVALFMSAGWSARYRLPLELQEAVVVGPRLYLKPLFPLLAGDGRFYLLALAQKGPELWRGSRHTIERVEVASLPQSLQDALQPERKQPQLRFEGRPPHHQGARTEAFSGQSVGTYDPKEPIVEYFRTLDAALHPLLREERAPLVLAGVEYLWPLYRAANSYPHLIEQGIAGNPQGMRPEELHEAAWRIVEPYFARPEREARSRFEELAGRQGAGRGDIRALDRIADVVPAATAGRVDSLFVALDAEAWGRVDDGSLAAEVHPRPEPGDEDLLNRAAVETYLKGGAVFAVPSERIPGRTPAAAILRF